MSTWNKTIIVDKTVKRISKVTRKESLFAYAFAGFDEAGEAKWTSKAEDVKLYDSTADAVVDAKKLSEQLPVEVMNYDINPEGKHVNITLVKF